MTLKIHLQRMLSILFVVTLLFSCQTMSFEDTDENEGGSEVGKKTMYFNLKGYSVSAFEPMGSDEQTRAAKAGDVTDNLMLGVFDKNGKLVGEFTTQDKNDEDFGTFSYTLTYGTYTILALGWNGTATCDATDINNITFSDNTVPQTFMCRQNIVVSANYSDTRTLTLKRCVANFYVSLKDTGRPDDLSKIIVAVSGAGNTLDSETKHCPATNNYTKELVVPPTVTPTAVSVYCFLPADESNVTFTVTAKDSQNNTIAEHTFSNTQMRINYKTVYTGYLYSSPTNGILDFDFDYEGTIEGTF